MVSLIPKHPLIAFFLLAGILISPAGLLAQPGNRGRAADIEPELDPEEGARRIAAFRQARLMGDYLFDFELRYMPRRGDDQVYRGVMTGTWNSAGPVTRIDIDANSPAAMDQPGLSPFRLLVQNGKKSERFIARVHGDSETERLEEADLFSPLLPGLTYTPFDLQMPFIFWDSYEYEGNDRVKGRPAHTFLMFPPENIREINTKLYAVRMALDADYNALLRVELLDENESIYKSFRVLNFKKVQDQWIIKTIDLVNDEDRDKTRLRILSASLGLDIDDAHFSMEGLQEPPRLPSSLNIEHL